MPTIAPPVQSSYERAHELFEREIQSRIAPEDRMKYLIIDLNSGDFEVGADEDAAQDRLEARSPGGHYYLMRANGGPAGYLGGWFR